MYECGGDVGSGPYIFNSTRWDCLTELLIFARLAVMHPDILPNTWSWEAFLAAACPAVSTALSKNDARRRYGSETLIAMRYVASIIYDSSVDSDEPVSATYLAVKAAATAHSSSSAWLADIGLFEGIGSSGGWKTLLDTLPPVTWIDEGESMGSEGDLGVAEPGGAYVSKSYLDASSTVQAGFLNRLLLEPNAS